MSYRFRASYLSFRDPGPPNHGWIGVRSFWTKSFGGRFAADYEQGVTEANEDIELDQVVNREALFAVRAIDRDKAWEARRDGFEDTLRKNDGTTLR